MAITKGALITRDTVFNYVQTLDFADHIKVQVDGPGVGKDADKQADGIFWIRNDPSLYLTPTFNAGTTYAERKRVSYDGSFYVSLQGGNIGNTPDISDTWWHEDLLAKSTTSYKNCWINYQVRGNINSAGDYLHFYLYKRTWNEGGTPIDVLITQEHATSFNINIAKEYTLEAGCYYYDIDIGSQGSASTTYVHIRPKKYANDVWYNEPIRVFDPDYQALAGQFQTEITVAEAKSGKLTTDNYFGGDFEVA